MSPTGFNDETGVLDAPVQRVGEGGADEVMPLSVCQTKTEAGTPVVVSCWRPTQDELNEIARTGRVWLAIMGATMPPVQVEGFRPSYMPAAEGGAK